MWSSFFELVKVVSCSDKDMTLLKVLNTLGVTKNLKDMMSKLVNFVSIGSCKAWWLETIIACEKNKENNNNNNKV